MTKQDGQNLILKELSKVTSHCQLANFTAMLKKTLAFKHHKTLASMVYQLNQSSHFPTMAKRWSFNSRSNTSKKLTAAAVILNCIQRVLTKLIYTVTHHTMSCLVPTFVVIQQRKSTSYSITRDKICSLKKKSNAWTTNYLICIRSY